MKSGRELDALVAEKVMGLTKNVISVAFAEGNNTLYSQFIVRPYSSRIESAWEIVNKLAPLVGDFKEADGWFKLQYADSAGHEINGCNPGEGEYDEKTEEDLSKWSAHFHLGVTGEETESAKLWGPGLREFCARGTTAPHAICLAALKAVGVDL